uniref:Subtilisin-2 n=1 Tax=Platynereis dumerilii TaxID=6359 RepID=A0A0A7MF60_PLADU|nr:subtilisin-2 [Platynereis dumerilii]
MRIALFAAFVCLAAALPNARQVQNLNHPGKIQGEFLIVLHAPFGKQSNIDHSMDVASRLIGIAPEVAILNFFTNLQSPILHVKVSNEAVMSQLFALDEVESIESNVEQMMVEQCSSQSSGSRIWGLSRTSSRAAPNYSGATYRYTSNNGAGVRVYVHDTSIRTSHNDYGNRAVFGANFVGGSNADNNGHGTHCAGTVGGGQYGIAKGATLVAVKVLGDSGSGSFSGIIAGLDWMVGDVQSRGVRGVGSMSLGGGISTSLDSAVNSADAAGIPVVVAAGNNNGNACNNSPARASGAITVGSTDISDNLSSFSNWGTCVNILAPGSSIISTSHLSNSGTRTLSGTSMACPHVAGLAAVYLANNPNASTSQVKVFPD